MIWWLWLACLAGWLLGWWCGVRVTQRGVQVAAETQYPVEHNGKTFFVVPAADYFQPRL